MNSESLRIVDQLRRAFAGDPWNGSSLRDLLAGVNAEQARARPLPSAHSIWELVLHIDFWAHAAADAAAGIPMPKLVGEEPNLVAEKDWLAVADSSPAAWTVAADHLFLSGERLAQAIEAFSDLRLKDVVPGRYYDFYYLFHGIVQHSLYHAGQIALLTKAVPAQ
jgi:hypothetical protein